MCLCFSRVLRSIVLAAVVWLAIDAPAHAVDVTIDSAAMTNGYMNVFELPSNGGGYVFGSTWGVTDLSGTFPSSTSVIFSPNSINDPSSFWYTPSGGPGATGNKIMEANLYAQSTGGLSGQTVNFKGNVASFTLQTGTNANTDFTFRAFVRDFAPDFSSVVETVVPISGTGDFTASLATINDPARHVQYGLQMRGPCVWVTDVAAKGSVTVNAVPEPSAYALLGTCGVVAAGWRRRRRGGS